jgi:hypothetical protein
MAARTIGCSIPSSSQTGVRTITTSLYLWLAVFAISRRLSVRPAQAESYDSYDDGVDSGARLFHPWKFE